MEIELESQSSSQAGTEKTTHTTESREDVQQSTVELIEKHQRKPRKDKGAKRGPRSGQREDAIPAIDPSLQINIDLVKKSVSALVGTVDAVVCRRIFNKATALGCDKNLAIEYTQSAGLTKDELVIVSECTSVIFARNEFLMRHAPEVMLGCVMASYTARVLMTLQRLDKLEKALKADKSVRRNSESGAQHD